MEHTFRQLQFNCGFLAARRTGLAGIVWRHLMEVFTIIVLLPNMALALKEHAPRRVRDRLRGIGSLPCCLA